MIVSFPCVMADVDTSETRLNSKGPDKTTSGLAVPSFHNYDCLVRRVICKDLFKLLCCYAGITTRYKSVVTLKCGTRTVVPSVLAVHFTFLTFGKKDNRT